MVHIGRITARLNRRPAVGPSQACPSHVTTALEATRDSGLNSKMAFRGTHRRTSATMVVMTWIRRM
jgi:hypothetical protein